VFEHVRSVDLSEGVGRKVAVKIERHLADAGNSIRIDPSRETPPTAADV
jgi:hypothetical protein